jgi:MHS family proline/betaine transporter-like MFS transporter
LYIEESVEKIDEAMAELTEQMQILQQKRDKLVDQHPELN